MSEAEVTTATYRPFQESDPRAGADELRSIMDQQSYLFFRGLLPVADVLQVRRDVLELCAEAGWLDPAHDLMDAVIAPGVEPLSEGKPEYMAVYRRVLKLPRFHDFPTHPALMEIARKLLGDDVLVHPRRIGRITFPHNTVATTPPHQDFFYIRGSVATYSVWTPLGACPISLGGLAVWPGSHRRGFVEHTETHPGAVGGRGVQIDETEAVWQTCDYAAGDALYFHSHTIHKALPNLSGDRLRISTDNRYQRSKDDIDPGSLQPHYNLS